MKSMLLIEIYQPDNVHVTIKTPDIGYITFAGDKDHPIIYELLKSYAAVLEKILKNRDLYGL